MFSYNTRSYVKGKQIKTGLLVCKFEFIKMSFP